MDFWLSHTITGVLGILAGSLPGFLLRLRYQTSVEWQAIVNSLRERVAVLENKIEELHKELAQRNAVEADLREKVATLQAMLTSLERKGHR
jgi:hypothetical protein